MNENLKTLRLLALGDADNSERDDLLEYCYNYASSKVHSSLALSQKKNELKVDDEIPEQLAWLVVEVAIRRFNRQGSEGYSSQTVEGQSITFAEDTDFINSEVDKYLDSLGNNGAKGRMWIY